MSKWCRRCGNLMPTWCSPHALYCSPECQFWSKTEERDGHIIWKGTVTSSGNRIFTYKPNWGKAYVTISARRFAFLTRFSGTIPPRTWIQVTCGEEDCVKPEHLALVNKGRAS